MRGGGSGNWEAPGFEGDGGRRGSGMTGSDLSPSEGVEEWRGAGGNPPEHP